MKTCSRCKETKELIEFYTDSSKAGYRYICKSCDKARIKSIQADYKMKLLNAAGGTFCVRCGYSQYIGALDFHHRDPSQKTFLLTNGMRKRPWEEVLDEIKKCDVLCSNCHREIHSLS